MSWPVFLGVCATLLGFAFLVWLGGRADERRWKREREEEESARHAAE
jgi:threonine/homoserine/homoserine lactone efflux protein